MWGGEVGKVRNVAIGIEFNIKERNKVMRVGFEQRMVVKVMKITVCDGEGESFQPCCARFRLGCEYYVITMRFEVFTKCHYRWNILRTHPMPLVLSEVNVLPPFLYHSDRLIVFFTWWFMHSGRGHGVMMDKGFKDR